MLHEGNKIFYKNWFQICLGVVGKGDQLASFDELYDMPEQDVLREDCQNLVGQYPTGTVLMMEANVNDRSAPTLGEINTVWNLVLVVRIL